MPVETGPLKAEQNEQGKLKMKVDAAYFANEEGQLGVEVERALKSLQALIDRRINEYIKTRDDLWATQGDALNDSEARLAVLTAERLLEETVIPQGFKKAGYDNLAKQGDWYEAAKTVEEGIYEPLEKFFNETPQLKALVDAVDEEDGDHRRAQIALAQKFPGMYPPEGTSERGGAMYEIEQAMNPKAFAKKQAELQAAWNESEAKNGGRVLGDKIAIAQD